MPEVWASSMRRVITECAPLRHSGSTPPKGASSSRRCCADQLQRERRDEEFGERSEIEDRVDVYLARRRVVARRAVGALEDDLSAMFDSGDGCGKVLAAPVAQNAFDSFKPRHLAASSRSEGDLPACDR